MSYWKLSQDQFSASSGIKRLLTESQRKELAGQLQHLADIYHIPGITTLQSDTVLKSARGKGFAVVSSVGGNTLSLEINNQAIYSYGANPFVVPFLRRDSDGKIVWEISSPAYYRNLGHTATPTANEFSEPSHLVIEGIEAITGQMLHRDFNTGHHGVSQCLVAPVTKSEKGYAVHYVMHQPDRTNLFPYEREIITGFDKKGRFIESIRLRNPNSFPIPISMLRHPYFYATESDFEHGQIVYVTPENSIPIYKLNEYSEVGEKDFRLPLLSNNEYIQFVRADGTNVNIGFAGDYSEQDSRVQIFSNGTHTMKTLNDFEEKHTIMRERLARLADLQHSLRLDDSWIDHRDTIDGTQIISDMMQDAHLCGLAIEDGVASGGNIYSDLEALKKARIMHPGQVLTFTRYTWVD